MPSDIPADQAGANRSNELLQRRRDKKTRRSVIVADKAADWIITVGGLGVILAVFGIMVFLLQVVVPLFTGGSVEGQRTARIGDGQATALVDLVDEYRSLSVAVYSDGKVKAFHVPTGQSIDVPDFDFGAAKLTSFGRTIIGNDVAFGFADGTVRFGKINLTGRVLVAGTEPVGLKGLDGRDRTDGKSIFVPIPGNQIRQTSVELTLGEPQKIAEGKAIIALDYRQGGTVERPTQAFLTVDQDGVARLSQAETKMNLLTRKATVSTNTATLPPLPAGTKVKSVLLTEKADQVYVADESGIVHRFDSRDLSKPTLAESVDLFPGNVQLTTLSFLLGEQSIVATGTDGSVDIYFRLQTAGAKSTDGYTLVRAHQLEKQPAAIVALDVSKRTKMLATADANGGVWVRHSTSEQTLLKLTPADGQKRAIKTLVMAPRDNGVLAVDDSGGYVEWEIAVPHPETTVGTIFGKVWYEGYSKPEYTWQSSSGTDSFEPKFSLVPLIFGTLKATFYSLLFAIPIALMAAIYTSEFVHPRIRSTVKPAMEMMASLPSVVLGFLAALIIAPWVENWLASVLLALLTIPLTLIGSAYAWQLLPEKTALRFGGLPKLVLIFVALFMGAFLAMVLGDLFERAFFAGDFKAWVNGSTGSGWPFMMFVLLPVCFLLATLAVGRTVGPRLSSAMRTLPRSRAGLLDGGRWIATFVIALVLAGVVAAVLTSAGWDLRGGVVDTYVQRNTMVVGFAMGFAVIPIIYTIAEDALNSVPEHLRGASLACGATPWQTAVRVILPTAASGVFAAVMIGMGRAVGETMIVVMAAGNTPILDWNIFNGLRALSANIAVELPEAVKDDSLYRMLFLAALTLFVMTFVVNTAAEIIRQRFRKRAMQL